MGKIKFDIAGWKEKLLNGVDINEPDESGLTALEQAILDDNISAVEFCIKQGADVNLNNKPMFLAAYGNKNPEVIKALLEYGADVNIRDDSGKTALWYTYKNYRARKILLHYKEQINRIDKRKIIK